MSQQDETSPAPANGQTASPPASPGAWRRLVIPVFAVLAAFGFIILATVRWDAWVGSAAVQSTNDAYIRADLTQLSSRVAGEVIKVAVVDFQRVKAGDLLVQIDPADYEAQVAQAEASVAAAQAALDNLNSQVELQYATIAQAEAQQASALAQEVEAHQEQQRQQSLTQTEAGTRQKLEQAIAGYASAQANVRASRALIAAQRHQLDVLSGPRSSAPLTCWAPRRPWRQPGSSSATRASSHRSTVLSANATFRRGTTSRTRHPADCRRAAAECLCHGELQGDAADACGLPGQPVDVTVDTFPNEDLCTAALRYLFAGERVVCLPAAHTDNATGNFTKVVQRIPVRIEFVSRPAAGRTVAAGHVGRHAHPCDLCRQASAKGSIRWRLKRSAVARSPSGGPPPIARCWLSSPWCSAPSSPASTRGCSQWACRTSRGALGLTFDEGSWLSTAASGAADPHRTRHCLARHGLRPATRPGRTKPCLYRWFRFSSLLSATTRWASGPAFHPRLVAGCLRPGDDHDRLAQSADESGGLSALPPIPFRLLLHSAMPVFLWSDSMCNTLAGSGSIGRMP